MRSTGSLARSTGNLARSTGGLAKTAGAHLTILTTPRRRVPWSEEFYLPPAELGKLHPGELIRYEPMHAYLLPGVRLRARAFRLLYRSTGAAGEATAVSGTLLLPDGIRRPRPAPLIGYAVGTHGIADRAAPSRLLSTGHDWEASMVALVLARGFALVATDYQGLGTPRDHTFMVGRALGNNVLDAVRAARWLAGAEPAAATLDADGAVAVMGYSEGGVAAAWAGQLQPLYAPELTLAGVAAGAAAADVELVAPALDRSRLKFFLAYGAIGYAAAYPDLELDRYLDERGRRMVSALRDSTVLQAAVIGVRNGRLDKLSNPSVLDLPQWRARLRENRLGTLAPQAPVLLHHARGDQIVAFQQSQQLYEDWRALGVKTSLHVTRGGFDHLSGGLAGAPVALDWLAGLFGKPALGVRTPLAAGTALGPGVKA
ncbi:MAG: lipase family protein [Solirubrobacteraceae bacterium]